MAKKMDFDLHLVEQYASEGLTEEQVAECFGVSRATITRRKAEDDAFDAAYKRGRYNGIQKVANALFQSAVNGNTTAQIFFLKSRAGFKETAVTEFSGDMPSIQVEFVNSEVNRK